MYRYLSVTADQKLLNICRNGYNLFSYLKIFDILKENSSLCSYLEEERHQAAAHSLSEAQEGIRWTTKTELKDLATDCAGVAGVWSENQLHKSGSKVSQYEAYIFQYKETTKSIQLGVL